jgi:hypothetical protein
VAGLAPVRPHEAGISTESAILTLADCGWQTLLAVGQRQETFQTTERPTARFLAFLKAAVRSGLAHLATLAGNQPDQMAVAYGWRWQEGRGWQAQGSRIGWLDDDELYLEPTTAYQVAQKAALPETLGLGKTSLFKQLKDQGLLRSREAKRGYLTTRKVIGGVREDVLHLALDTLQVPILDEDGYMSPDVAQVAQEKSSPLWERLMAPLGTGGSV